MSSIKALVVDDSAVARRVISKSLSLRKGIEVVATAFNGRFALQKAQSVHPDVIVLDVEMPEMDGLATIRALREQGFGGSIVMCSSHTSRGAAATIEALMLGADGYVTKPSHVSGVEASVRELARELGDTIFALVGKRKRPSRAAPRMGGQDGVRAPAERRAGNISVGIEVVVVGVSTGGPQVLNRLIPALPSGLHVPILIVQHMPPLFTAQLSKRLDLKSAVEVLEGKDGMELRPGRVIIAPGGLHMGLARLGGHPVVRTNKDPSENSCRPAADVLFRAAVREYGGRVLAVVLTGMGRDGLAGSRLVAEAGGHVLVQDEESSAVWGMPGAVADAGIAHSIVPLEDISTVMLQLLGDSKFTPNGEEQRV